MPMRRPRTLRRALDRHADQFRAVEARRAAGPAVGGQQPDQAHHRLALARARLADDAERLAARQREAEIAHRVHLAVGRVEADVQLARR
jgi:hypothetical protein